MKHQNLVLTILMLAAFCIGGATPINAQGGPINQQIARGNFLKSLPSFQTAAKLMFGREKTEGQLSQYFNGLFAIKYGMKKVIDLGEANPYLKEYVAKPEKADLRREVIENFMWDARGRKPDKAEYEAYDGLLKMQKTNYAQELLNQSKYLKETQSEKNLMTNRAYQAAYCRDASAAELASSDESLYTNKIDELRGRLYSPSQATNLRDMIEVWWRKRFKTRMSTANLQSALEAFTPVKSLCSEFNKRWDATEIK